MTFMVFDLYFANNIILSCFLFLINDLYFLIPVVIAQIYNPIAELVIPPAQTEIHPVTTEAKIEKCSIYFRVVQTFLCLLLINSF